MRRSVLQIGDCCWDLHICPEKALGSSPERYRSLLLWLLEYAFPPEKRIVELLIINIKTPGKDLERLWNVLGPTSLSWCPGVATVSKRRSETPVRWIPGSFYARWLARSAFTEVPHNSWGSQMQGDCLWKNTLPKQNQKILILMRHVDMSVPLSCFFFFPRTIYLGKKSSLYSTFKLTGKNS